MKFVDSYNFKDFEKDIKEQKFNKNGEVAVDSEKVFAQATSIDIGKNKNQVKYQIMTFNNNPYDPMGIDSHRESNLRIELKSTSKQAFDYYLLYLQTKNNLYLTRSQRSYING